MSGWNGSNRRAELPSNWADLVRQVKQRDGNRCVWKLPSGARCPRPGKDVDHMGSKDNHSLWNLRLLCRHHHDLHTQSQARRAKRAKRSNPGRRRHEDPHPGIRPA